jgi:ADP-heptose:LPS heptosyltransferase
MHCAHVPELIKKHYGIDYIEFETSNRGMDILWGNPFIDKLTQIPMSMEVDIFTNRWAVAEDEFDMFFNLTHSIELKYCTIENDHRYWRNSKYRREKCGQMNFYDASTDACGLPPSYYGTRGKLYYTDAQHQNSKEWVRNLKEKYKADWLIIVVVSGSSLHKRFQQVHSVCAKILDKYPTALIVLSGDKDCTDLEPVHERIVSRIGKTNFRTMALNVKYADLVISPETGLVCVSHSWDTPTIQLLTAASWDNHIKYAKNAYWVQSPIECSPCHKSPSHYYGCPVRDRVPACVFFDEDEIMTKVEEAHNVSR